MKTPKLTDMLVFEMKDIKSSCICLLKVFTCIHDLHKFESRSGFSDTPLLPMLNIRNHCHDNIQEKIDDVILGEKKTTPLILTYHGIVLKIPDVSIYISLVQNVFCEK